MKTTSTQHASLLKKYHTICTISGISKDNKADMLAGYGVESSKDLTEKQLCEIMDTLQKEPEAWRRRVMASIGAWLRLINKTDNADIIKGIACRIAKQDNFNAIPVSRLRDIYYEFSRKSKTVQTTQMVMADEITYLKSTN